MYLILISSCVCLIILERISSQSVLSNANKQTKKDTIGVHITCDQLEDSILKQIKTLRII